LGFDDNDESSCRNACETDNRCFMAWLENAVAPIDDEFQGRRGSPSLACHLFYRSENVEFWEHFCGKPDGGDCRQGLATEQFYWYRQEPLFSANDRFRAISGAALGVVSAGAYSGFRPGAVSRWRHTISLSLTHPNAFIRHYPIRSTNLPINGTLQGFFYPIFQRSLQIPANVNFRCANNESNSPPVRIFLFSDDTATLVFKRFPVGPR
jgi:hypothetical protein